MRCGFLIAVVPIALACAAPVRASEKATVRILYLLEPTRGIPAGLDALAVLDAGVNDEKGALTTNTDWSELAANHVQHLLQEATDQHGIILDFVDRRHTATVLKEHDLAAAGLVPSNTAGQAAQLLAVQGIIMAEINVRIERHRETKKKIDIGGVRVTPYWANVCRIEATVTSTRPTPIPKLFHGCMASGRAAISIPPGSWVHVALDFDVVIVRHVRRADLDLAGGVRPDAQLQPVHGASHQA